MKTTAQQDLQALARLREGTLRSRTALANRLLGLLSEYGMVVNQGVNTLRRVLPELLEDAANGLNDRFRRLLAQGQQQLIELDAHVEVLTDELKAAAKADDGAQRLQTIPGFGPIVASVFAATLGDGGHYRRGRDAAAAVGLVPRQHSTGGKSRLLGISKRGDRYLRCLLVHGARSVVIAAHRKDDRLSRWINRLRETRGINKATVALANKLTRIGWAVLKHNGVYQPACGAS
ncbi:MAG: IS110 family transposase [Methylococcales bacterium]